MKLSAGREKHIFAADKYPTGHLKLVPHSQTISIAADGGRAKSQTTARVTIGGETFTVALSAGSLPKPSQSGKPFAKAFVVPYWLVRETDDSDRGNMHRSTLKCTMSFTAGKESTAEDAIIIPILQNSRAVKEGEELLVYNGDLVKAPASIEPVERVEEPAMLARKRKQHATAKQQIARKAKKH